MLYLRAARATAANRVGLNRPWTVPGDGEIIGLTYTMVSIELRIYVHLFAGYPRQGVRLTVGFATTTDTAGNLAPPFGGELGLYRSVTWDAPLHPTNVCPLKYQVFWDRTFTLEPTGSGNSQAVFSFYRHLNHRSFFRVNQTIAYGFLFLLVNGSEAGSGSPAHVDVSSRLTYYDI